MLVAAVVVHGNGDGAVVGVVVYFVLLAVVLAGGIADPFLAGPASTPAGFAAFPDVTTPAKANSPPKKTNDDILKMFDTPRAFGGPGLDPMGGFLPALPARQGVTSSYMPMHQVC